MSTDPTPDGEFAVLRLEVAGESQPLVAIPELASITRLRSSRRQRTTPWMARSMPWLSRATAASRASSPWAALPNRVWLSASMPTSSPRKGTRFR